MVQKYGNVPFVVNVKLKRAFGAILPELNAAPLVATDVWVVLSLFNQLTVVPTATVAFPGL